MDKETLFKPRLTEADVEVPDVGTVRVRGLNRVEAMQVQGAGSTEAVERKMLAFGMVDPKLTEDDVRRWQEASAAGEMEVVSAKIAELSGLTPDAGKEAYKSLPSESGS